MREFFKQRGYMDGVLLVLSAALAKTSAGRCKLGKYYLVAQPVRRQPVLTSKASASPVARIVTRGDPIVAQFPRPQKILDLRFKSGAICFAAETNGRFAGFLWLKTGDYEEDEFRCLFQPRPAGCVAWDFDVYIEPSFRLGRTFARLWDAAHEFLRSAGVEWTLSRITAFNLTSLQSHARLGAMIVGWVTFVSFGPLQLTIMDRWPYLHASARREHRPRIVVAAPEEGPPPSV